MAKQARSRGKLLRSVLGFGSFERVPKGLIETGAKPWKACAERFRV